MIFIPSGRVGRGGSNVVRRFNSDLGTGRHFRRTRGCVSMDLTMKTQRIVGSHTMGCSLVHTEFLIVPMLHMTAVHPAATCNKRGGYFPPFTRCKCRRVQRQNGANRTRVDLMRERNSDSVVEIIFRGDRGKVKKR